jgi:hypothetical protein
VNKKNHKEPTRLRPAFSWKANETSGPPNQVVALTLTVTLHQPPGLVVRPKGKLGLGNRLGPPANTPFFLGLILQQKNKTVVNLLSQLTGTFPILSAF